MVATALKTFIKASVPALPRWRRPWRSRRERVGRLRFQFHRLEKGLCMPEAQQDPTYLGAMGTLLSSRRRIQGFVDADPRAVRTAQSRDVYLRRASAGFDNLTMARRSMRHLRPEPVDPVLLQRAIAFAQRSPTACNRQPCLALQSLGLSPCS